MTKRVLSIVLMTYASTSAAMPSFAALKNLQPSSLIEQVRLGLNSSMPPKTTLDDAWYSTFLIYFNRPDDGFVASGFVVKTAWRKDGRRTIDLVTSEHVLAQGCTNAGCTNVMIFQDANFVIERDGSMSGGNSQPLGEPEFKIIARNPGTDLALVRITVDGDIDPRPVRLSPEGLRPGDRVWAIGFPEVYKRASGRGIDRKNIITRRWSEGEVTGAVAYNEARTRLVSTAGGSRSNYATTADALPGSSGGPMLNDAGELTCVLKSAGALPTNKFEFSPAEVVPSACVPVASVRDLLESIYGRAFAQN